jgi:glycosyltransferase involved in cell wall biosynthesis
MVLLNTNKQLHLVQSVATDFGGLGYAALRYSQSVALAGGEVCLYVVDRSKDEILYNLTYGKVSFAGGFGSGLLSRAIALVNYCNANRFDIVHIHGTWTPILAIASFIALFKKIPLIISPHGCLEPWALQHRGFKKKFALALYQHWIFSKAALMVATAKQELFSIRQIGVSVPIAVIPNGVDIPVEPVFVNSGVMRKFLFLSRLHPKKGLSDLVMAWAKVRRPGWTFVIAGPDENGHRAEMETLIDSLGLKEDFEFTGLALGEKKEALFAEADVFILPTYSENFGLVVAEALAREIPVITTTGAPWRDLEDKNCGWWVKPGVEGVASGLIAAMNSAPDMLCEMGRRGRQLIIEKYDWENIGMKALAASEWALDQRGTPPDCVNVEI